MATLRDNPGASVNALAKAAGANPSSTGERLRGLASRGVVTKDSAGHWRLVAELPERPRALRCRRRADGGTGTRAPRSSTGGRTCAVAQARTLTTGANAASFRSRDTVKGESHRGISPHPSVPAAVFGGVFLMRRGISPLRNLLFQVGTSVRKTVVNYNGFPRRDARSPVETFNTPVRKLSKLAPSWSGVGNGNEDQV